MKKAIGVVTLFYLFISAANAQNLYSALDDQSEGITEGYGSWGNHTYVRESTVEVPNKGTITFYHPDIAAEEKPTIIFINGWGRDFWSYDKTLKYIASLGYPVIDIYNYNPGNIQESYGNSLDMILQAAEFYQEWIDTSKIGIMGHSYGGGASIWLGSELFGEYNWGSNGRFIMMFAPWFSLLVDNQMLEQFPENTKLLILQSYDDFATSGATYNTDPRAVRAVFQLINIPNADKDFITIHSDDEHTYDIDDVTYYYEANHYVSYTGASSDGTYYPYDLLDVYSSNRLIHAMTDLVFQENTDATQTVLGNESLEQINMGTLPDLSCTDFYIAQRDEALFNYKCSTGWYDFADDSQVWLLQDYCDDLNQDGVIDVLSSNEIQQKPITIYPNPADDNINFRLSNFYDVSDIETISIYNLQSQCVLKIEQPKYTSIDISQLTSGTYMVIIEHLSRFHIQKLIIR